MTESPQQSDCEETTSKRELRNRFVLLGAGVSLLSKFPSLLVTLFSVPMAIDALGEQRFGIWITITTMVSLLSFLDGGAGNAIVNVVAECNQDGKLARMRSLIASVYVFVGMIALSCLVAQFAVVPSIDWTSLLSLPDNIPNSEVVTVAIVACSAYFISMPLSIASRILMGIQRTHIVAISNSIAHFATLLFTFIAWLSGAGLTAFILCFAANQVIAGAINSTIVFFRDKGKFRPKFANLSRNDIVTILSSGSLFWTLQLCMAISFQSDAIIVSHFVGLEETAKLGLVSRMFLVANSITMLATGPLWPAFREAGLSNDTQWIRSAFRKATSRCLLISVALTLPLAIFFQPINQIWTGGAASPDYLLVGSVFVWSNLLVIGRVMAMLLNGLHVIRLQVICSVAMAIVNIVLSIVLTRQIGAAGVVIGSIIAYTLIIVIPYSFILPRIIGSTNRVVSAAT